MAIGKHQQALLRKLPGVDHVLTLIAEDDYFADIPQSVIVAAVRRAIDAMRRSILTGQAGLAPDAAGEAHIIAPQIITQITDRVRTNVDRAMQPNLRHTVNAAGIVVHTNLGRSLLACQALTHLQTIAGRYSNLEYNLDRGRRGSRYSAVEDLLCELTGAEAAMVVNNNAGAVLLSLNSLADGREVVISRGELVEIGGSFRIPDVMQKSGAQMREVGTTNRTHLRDYENAVGVQTGLLLKVHTSNYSVVGFTASLSLTEIVALGRRHQIPVMEDLGSGNLIDFSRYGLKGEPTVQQSVAAGVDVITFSGDKLLGGPQAGIILGRRNFIDTIRHNPLTRALRIDKLTLAALEATLRLYRDPEAAVAAIPTLQMITRPAADIKARAEELATRLRAVGDRRLTVTLLDLSSKTGGGALPLLDLPSRCVGIRVDGLSVNAVERALRAHVTPIIGRIEAEFFVMDLRTVLDDELDIIVNAFTELIKEVEP